MSSPLIVRPKRILSMFRDEEDMARRRMQKSGWLHDENGQWKLTYREDQRSVEGKIVRARPTVTIGPSTGPGKLSRRQAQQIAQDHYLSKVNQVSVQPQTMATLSEFWTSRFEAQCNLKLRKTTREQYFSLWRKWIEPSMGKMRLRDVGPDEVERAVGYAIAAGKSSATAKHIRKVISKIFSSAKKARLFTGDNPASLAEMPIAKPVRKITALNWEQAAGVLAALPDVVRQMAFTSMVTSMNVAELCGLRWKHINLSGDWEQLDGEALPPGMIAVREHFARGEFGALKTGKRRRNVPVPEMLLNELKAMRLSSKRNGPEDTVFASRRTGLPINENSTRKRILRPVGEKFKIHNLSWHMFRHSHATWTKIVGMSDHDRQALMGHGSIEMTDRYTHADLDRMRDGVEQVARRIIGANAGPEIVH